MKFWNPTYECMPREEMRKLQSERLIDTVNRVYQNVPFYRNKMQKKGVEPGDIKSIDDLNKLPFTYKQDLRDTYPYGMFAAPKSEIIRVHASSGTTGKQTVVGYTRRDLDMWSEVMARALVGVGFNKEDFLQISLGFGLFTGAFGYQHGAERIGTSVIPISGGNTKRQVQVMKDFGATGLTCTPSYAMFMIEMMEEMGISKDDLKMRLGIFGGEAWSTKMREEIENGFGIKAYDMYGLSEIIGPGVACECREKKDLHVNEDHFVPEIIDPDTEEVLPYGTKGELVFTTITKEGLPLLRYRTRDVSSLYDDVCDCGKTSVRMKKVTGRTDDMLIIRGVNIFPTQIESVLLEMGETAPHYQLIINRKGNLDTIDVLVEMTQNMFSDEYKKIMELENKIKGEIKSVLGISTKVKLVEPKSIERGSGKAKRVIDNRNI